MRCEIIHFCSPQLYPSPILNIHHYTGGKACDFVTDGDERGWHNSISLTNKSHLKNATKIIDDFSYF
jgi:hypothetical protein